MQGRKNIRGRRLERPKDERMASKTLLIIILIFLSLNSINAFAFEISDPIKLGDAYQENQIIITKQDYLDKYIQWNFTEINNTHWRVDYTIDKNLIANVTTCLNKSDNKTKCYEDFCDKYLSTDLKCEDSKDKDKLSSDISKLNNYPIENLTASIISDKKEFDYTKDSGSFYIIFPKGFKAGESIKIGFNSTIVNTTYTVPFASSQRAICRDSSNIIHIAWSNSSTTTFYANSSDNATTWNVNTSFAPGTFDWISCDGNNITVLTSVGIYISIDNGATWTNNSSIVGDAIERRGQKVYVFGISANEKYINMTNSSDGGSTWSDDSRNLTFSGSGGISTLTLAVNGTGGISDIIYVAWSTGASTLFTNSTDSGNTFGNPITIGGNDIGGGDFLSYEPSITFSGNTIQFVRRGVSYPGIMFRQSTDGIGFTSKTFAISNVTTAVASLPSVTIDNNGNPWAFWQQTNTTSGYSNIVFRYCNGTACTVAANWNCDNSSGWRPLGDGTYHFSMNITTDFLSHQSVSTKYNYNGDRIELVWYNGSSAPFNIMYAYIKPTNTPPTWSSNTSSTPSVYNPNTYSTFNITWADDSDSNAFNLAYFESNYSGTLTNYTATRPTGTNRSEYQIILPVGTFAWRLYAKDSSEGEYNAWNYTSQWAFTISQNATNPVHLNMSKDSFVTNFTDANISVGTTDMVNISCWSDYSDAGDCEIYIDGASQTNPYSNTIGAGTHSVLVNTSGNTNYTANATGLTFYIISTAPGGASSGGGGGGSPVILLRNITVYSNETGFCGDGFCNLEETTETCSIDCKPAIVPQVTLWEIYGIIGIVIYAVYVNFYQGPKKRKFKMFQ